MDSECHSLITMMGVSGERCLITSRSQTLAYMANEPYTDTEANGRTWSIDRRFSEKDVSEFLSAWATQQSANQIGPWHLILKKQFRRYLLALMLFLEMSVHWPQKKMNCKWMKNVSVQLYTTINNTNTNNNNTKTTTCVVCFNASETTW